MGKQLELPEAPVALNFALDEDAIERCRLARSRNEQLML
jgi:hypothetical protein